MGGRIERKKESRILKLMVELLEQASLECSVTSGLYKYVST